MLLILHSYHNYFNNTWRAKIIRLLYTCNNYHVWVYYNLSKKFNLLLLIIPILVLWIGTIEK